MRSVWKLLDRARRHIRGADLTRLVPSDPGAPGYVRAFTAIVEEGESILGEDYEGMPLYRSFDFTETVGLTRWGRVRDRRERWFRVLTCAAHLAARPHGEDQIPLHYSLVTLLSDAYALEDDGNREAPVDLLDGVMVDMRESVERGEGDPFASHADAGFCILAQLLAPSPQEPDVLCLNLDSIHHRANSYFIPGTQRENLATAAGEEFVWGLTFFDQLHADWLALVVSHFPTDSPLQQATEARLIEDGKKWSSRERKLSS